MKLEKKVYHLLISYNECKHLLKTLERLDDNDGCTSQAILLRHNNISLEAKDTTLLIPKNLIYEHSLEHNEIGFESRPHNR